MSRPVQEQHRGRIDPTDVAAELHEHVIKQLFAVGLGLQGLLQAVEDPRLQRRIGAYVDVLDDTIRALRTTICELAVDLPAQRRPR